MAELDQITVATRRMIRAKPALVDAVFNNDPLLAYAKLNAQEKFGGGRQINEGFLYNGLIGGAYLKGKEFDITERQIEQQLQFNIKYYQINVTLAKEDIQVENVGENAVFKLVDSRITAAYMSLGAHLAISLYLNGQRAGFTAMVNGLAEVCNDNSTVSWDNNTYATYGTITRGGAVGTVLNSVPTDVNGTIEYNTLEETYSEPVFGNIEPNLGVTTPFGYSFIKEKFQTQQRFNDTQDPAIGFNGLKFNSATIIRSRYCPGAHLMRSSGTNDPIAVTFMDQSSSGALVAYPAPVGGYPGATAFSETLWWINARREFFTLYISSNAEYGFGFTGWKPAQGNTKVAGQVLVGCALVLHPRYHKQLYRITG